jgi:hypothetical protein
MTRRHGGLDFVTAPCAPLATFSPYRPTFAHARHSGFHVAHVRGIDFGNYPAPVLIRGHGVACDARERTFLIEYRDAAAFSLACLRPGARVKP